MRRSIGVLLFAAALPFAFSGCMLLDGTLHSANRAQCNGLPGEARRDCLRRRGEREYPFAGARMSEAR